MAARATPATITVTVAGEAVTVALSRSARARRLRLVADPVARGFRLSLPARASVSTARRFLDGQQDWINSQRARFVAPRPLAIGSSLMLEGEPHSIMAGDPARRGIERREGQLVVHGRADVAGARLAAWLKAQAKAALMRDLDRLRDAIPRGRALTLRVGDARSRWGSCSARGALAFNWRLIMAPAAVRQSVVAHEVAHLTHMNHSEAFWALATCLHLRGFGGDTASARRWLKDNGASLRAVGLG